MHYSTRRRVALGLTTGGLLAAGLSMTTAQADAGASASGGAADSPGVGSGNLIQLPINLPVNLCGNQVGVIGILDTVSGNSCENKGDGSGASASGSSHGSPGVGSGNLIQVPVNAPVNICGNQLDIIGIGNSDHGNSCENKGKGDGGASASGSGSNSPGIGAGNVLQVPVNAPVNVCGNQLDVIGILDSVTGNSCENGGSGNGSRPHPTPPPTPAPTPTPSVPIPTPTPTSTPPAPTPTSTPTGCSCPPPPPPTTTTPCPPGSSSHSDSKSNGSTRGSANSGHHGHAPLALSEGPDFSRGGLNAAGGSGQLSGVLAHTGTDALAFAPLGAGLFGGGVALRRRVPKRGK